MKPIQSSPSYSLWQSSERGFGLLEFIVAMGLSGIMFGLIVQNLVLQSDYYHNDVRRARVQQNTRGVLDILSMNVRQTGEALDSFFPALLLQDGAGSAPDTLILRRNLLVDVLSLCTAATPGAVQVFVSDSSSSDTDCLPANVATSITNWSTFLASEGGSTSIYIYDRVGETGEFLTYSGNGTSGGGDYLDVSALVASYPVASTSLYMLEEYSFSLDLATETLQLSVNGDTLNTFDVGYTITDFQVDILLNDGTTITSLADSDSNTWKDIRAVRITLQAQDDWKGTTFLRAVTGEYFPRNVLSG